ncbi:MAG: hypothetical protein KAG64_01615 [Bacteroidales bacterium]|nr:hypothetical protein [Bacteroidales bacterium]
MASPHKRHGNSILAEWLLKFVLIFFIASIFFDEYAIKFLIANGGSLSGFMTYLKIALILVFGIVISAISQSSFKIVGFVSIIIGSLFKIIMKISDEIFMAVDIINLADEFLLIGVATFYLYRHHRHEKQTRKVVKKKSQRA